MKYHDTHFHLDLMPNPIDIVKQIEKSKIYTIAITNSPQVYFYTENITKNCKYIRPALGFHPELVYERHQEIDKFISLLNKTKYIGEIGLDNYNKSPANYKKQILVFEKIVDACSSFEDKILTIHSRRAENDLLNIIGDNFPGKVILHWYSGTIKNLEKAIARGYYFSINYPMTNSKNGQKIIDRIPINQILIESDGPFTSIGSKNFTPLMVGEILDRICYLKKDYESKELKQKILSNFYGLIKT
ncbi:Qat anti-phage system TatD family nuclease QatD [Ulvibacterium marinum]|uniref:Qat anti-phage system TatD family nuclease QatD n=1 Tax=Ulvibacterium marinum TaxID=2419782 RepID=UPI002495671C|nr:Qat anti-phage system TatD family nuclease QatD [Ulvibacterium marinum]